MASVKDGIAVTMKIIDLFFDNDEVEKAVNRATLRYLGRASAAIRAEARGSIRKRKRPSLPGYPPSRHRSRSEFGIHTILFGIDRRQEKAFIGPLYGSSKTTGVNVPTALERGGRSIAVSTRKVNGRTKRQRRRQYLKARPFMKPALKKKQVTLSKIYREEFRGAARQARPRKLRKVG